MRVVLDTNVLVAGLLSAADDEAFLGVALPPEACS